MTNQSRIADFLRGLKEQFKISRIFYPGADTDTVLEGPFTLREIFYLDKDRPSSAARFEREGHYILAKYFKLPIRDGVFDALYYQDNHTTLEGTVALLMTVRPSGIVIHSNDTCPGELSASAMEKVSGISKVSLPYSNHYYTVFQKT